MFEHERNRTFGTHVTAEFRKGVANFRNSSDPVVGQTVNDDGCTIDAVTFITDFFIIDAVQCSGATGNGTLHVFFRHIGCGRFFCCESQARVTVDVAAAHSGCHGNFLDQPGPDFSAFCVGSGFFMFNIGPFAMSRHLVLSVKS
jgi:hypothetical protein